MSAFIIRPPIERGALGAIALLILQHFTETACV
jgi:hypothetical protein